MPNTFGMDHFPVSGEKVAGRNFILSPSRGGQCFKLLFPYTAWGGRVGTIRRSGNTDITSSVICNAGVFPRGKNQGRGDHSRIHTSVRDL